MHSEEAKCEMNANGENIALNIRMLLGGVLGERHTVAELADALGTTRGAVTNWAKGRRTPDEMTIERIAGFFGIAPEDMHKDVLKLDSSLTRLEEGDWDMEVPASDDMGFGLCAGETLLVRKEARETRGAWMLVRRNGGRAVCLSSMGESPFLTGADGSRVGDADVMGTIIAIRRTEKGQE